MSTERHFAPWREVTHVVHVPLIRPGYQKGRLRVPDFSRNGLHVSAIEASRVQNNPRGIAATAIDSERRIAQHLGHAATLLIRASCAPACDDNSSEIASSGSVEASH